MGQQEVQDSSGDKPMDDETALKGIAGIASNAASRIAQRENTNPAGNAAAGNAADWNIITTAVSELADINPAATSGIIIDTLSKVKNTSPEYRELWDRYQGIAGKLSGDEVHEGALEMYSDAVKLGEKRQVTEKSGHNDHTHEVPDDIRAQMMKSYLREVEYERDDSVITAADSMAKLLADPAVKGAKDTGDIWKQLDQSVNQAADELYDGSKNLAVRRAGLRVLVSDLDRLQQALPENDIAHRKEIDALLKDSLYPTALKVREDMVAAGSDSLQNWQGDTRPGIIGRFETQSVDTPPTRPTASQTTGQAASPTNPSVPDF